MLKISMNPMQLPKILPTPLPFSESCLFPPMSMMSPFQSRRELRRIPLLRRWVNSADATLKPLGASRSLQPSQARNLLPPPSLPGLRCSGQTSPLNVRRIGGVAMAGKPALASVPVTQEPYRNRDCEDSRAHSFCHAKYTHVSQTLWRGIDR